MDLARIYRDLRPDPFADERGGMIERAGRAVRESAEREARVGLSSSQQVARPCGAATCDSADPCSRDVPPASIVTTPASLRAGRLRRVVRTVVDQATGWRREKSRWVFVTLTLRQPEDWRPGMLGEFFHRVRAWASRRGVRLGYCWVAELQERGAVHYHVMCDVPVRLTLPMPDRRGWWPHGMSRIERVKRNAKGYICAYISQEGAEGVSPVFPRSCRTFGVGGVGWQVRWWLRWLRLPSYVRALCEPADCARRVPGGFWIASRSVFVATKYVVSTPRKGVVCMREKTIDEQGDEAASVERRQCEMRRIVEVGVSPESIVDEAFVADVERCFGKLAADALREGRYLVL